MYVMPVAFGNGGSIPVSTLELTLLGASNTAFFTVMNDADLVSLVDSITAVVCPGKGLSSLPQACVDSITLIL